jgi:hypothetical protein
MATETPDHFITPMYLILPTGGSGPNAKVAVTVTVTAPSGKKGSASFDVPSGSKEIDLNGILSGAE